VSDRNAFFEEGVKLDEEARMRRSRLEEIKKKKLNELRYLSRICSVLFLFCMFYLCGYLPGGS
jgi:hypothetical protein